MEKIKEKIAEIIDSVTESTVDFGDHEQCTLDADDVYWLANKLEEYQEKAESSGEIQKEVERLNEIILFFTVKDLIDCGIKFRIAEDTGINFNSNADYEKAKQRAGEMGYYDWLFDE